MKNLIQAAAVTLFAASAAHAQQAVQWRVKDGGNGHWYSLALPSPSLTWQQSAAYCASMGGHLTTITSEGENQFVGGVIISMSPTTWGAGAPPEGGWLGGFYADDSWRWVTGEPWGFTEWNQTQCIVGGGDQPSPPGVEPLLQVACVPGGRCKWDDICVPSTASTCVASFVLMEWSADCNGDGIVDYGQCHDGTLPDYNGNNIPDCCESGSPCLVGNYPVQWRVEDGGNGHWYCTSRTSAPVSWSEARVNAERSGGYLATLTTSAENLWVFTSSAKSSGTWECEFDCYGPWLGGYQQLGSCEPDCGWRWITEEPWSFTSWAPGLPNNAGPQHWLHFYGSPELDGPLSPGPRWDDVEIDWPMIRGFVTEWSADCNGDGIVDYGQILQGQFADVNQDGVPDMCQQLTCVDADLFRDFTVNGADLGILLSQWGPNTPLTVSDINRDGVVDGSDLGILLSFWGACP